MAATFWLLVCLAATQGEQVEATAWQTDARTALPVDDDCEASEGECALQMMQLQRRSSSHDAREVLAAQVRSSRAATKLAVRSSTGTRWVGGRWTKDQKMFTYENVSGMSYLYNWVSDSGAALNVTSTEALKWTGPLTLLQALEHCPDSSLGSAVARARQKEHLVLHVVGVSGSLEPMMDWDHFLVGPLSAREQLAVEHFNLPVAPFAEIKNVTLVYNEYEDSKHVRRMGPFAPGFSEKFVFGPYHEAVNEVPDAVFALNPGFAHYPNSWYSTLRYLHSLKVPVVATGYGDAMQTIYEYSQSFTSLDVQDNLLQLPHAQLDHAQASDYVMSPGGGSYFLEGKMEVLNYMDTKGQLVYAKRVFPLKPDQASLAVGPFVQSCRTAATSLLLEDGSDEEEHEVSGICSDLNGTFFLSQQAGYKVTMSSRSAFQYCDHAPHDSGCDSNGVVALLEPKVAKTAVIQSGDSRSEGYSVQEDFRAPSQLFEKTIRKAMSCTMLPTRELTACVERRLAAGPQSDEESESGMFLNMDNFFDTVRKECSDDSLEDTDK